MSTYPDSTLGTEGSGYGLPGATDRVALVYKIADRRLRKEHVDGMVFTPWIGKEGEMSPIITKTDLTKNKGEQIRMALLPKLDEYGKPGDLTVLQSEEVMDFSYQDVYVNQLRHAIRTVGRASDQRGLFSIIENARPALTSWLNQRKEAEFFRTVYYGWPAFIHCGTAYGGLNLNSHIAKPCRYWYCMDEENNAITYSATDATYETSIETAEGTLANTPTDWFSPQALISMAAKMRKLNFPMIDFKGFTGYLCILHPNQVAQLQTHEKWFEANITAGPRDEKGNAVFKGVGNAREVGCWGGFYIMESNKIDSSNPSTLYTDSTPIAGAAEANVKRAICMGANALAYAVADEPHFEVESIDYKNQTGVAVVTNFGIARADYTLDVSATATITAQHTMVLSSFSPDAAV